MNVTHCRTTDVELALDNLISLDDDYKTTPILAITSIPQRPDEEALHAQFEKALRKRTKAFERRSKQLRNSASLNYKLQRILIYFCCALSCILLGFDLMGLLVLHLH